MELPANHSCPHPPFLIHAKINLSFPTRLSPFNNIPPSLPIPCAATLCCQSNLGTALRQGNPWHKACTCFGHMLLDDCIHAWVPNFPGWAYTAGLGSWGLQRY